MRFPAIETREVRDPVSGDVCLEAYAISDDKAEVAVWQRRIPYIDTEAKNWPTRKWHEFAYLKARLAKALEHLCP